jgi:hypothetical protein
METTLESNERSPLLVYVCLGCGRRSCDRMGIFVLTKGWGASCAKRAILLPSSSLKLDSQGLVKAVSKEALLEARRVSSN